MYDSPTLAALASGGLVLRDFLRIAGKDAVGVQVNFGFWTGADDVTVNVVSAATGNVVSRDYVGGGKLLDVPAIVDAIGLEARSVTFGLSQLHDDTEDMVRGYNIRVAPVELHRGLFDPATWELVSTPYPRFAGRVDYPEVNTAAEGEEGGISLTAISGAIDLTKTNPAMKSDEQQRLRSGDRFRRYSDAAGQVEVFWGQVKGSAA